MRLASNDKQTPLATTRYQLENQSANGLRLVLPRRTRQSIRPFKAVRSFNSHFPVFAGARTCDRHPPVSRSGAECVLNTRHNSSAQFGISKILQFNRDAHHTCTFIGDGMPVCGANQASLSRTALRANLEQAVSQHTYKPLPCSTLLFSQGAAHIGE